MLSQSENASIIPAIVQVNSFEFDADGDDISDKLICDYWARWGSTVCDVERSVFGYPDLSLGFSRVGVLATKSDGLSDLVCNHFSVRRFDGEQYGAAN